MNICIMLLVAFDRPLCEYLYNAACSFDSLYVNICIMLPSIGLYVNICIMLLVAFDRPLCEYLYNAACSLR